MSEVSLEKILTKWRVPRSEVEGLERVTDTGISKGGRTGKNQAERVGKGHFGEVVKASWHGEAVVVKVSRTKSLDERRMREARADLENECRLLATMDPHVNVVAIKGIIQERSPPFFGLMLAFYSRGSMKATFKEEVIPLRTKVKVLYGISLGIAYCHQQGIEHRDLWPANVLLAGDFTAKLADFGLAITRNTSKISNKCQFRWSSPERCQNHIKRTNRFQPKNDVWSFGMIGYWAMTNEKPFAEIEKGNMVRFRLERGDKPRFDARLRLPSELVEALGVCWRFSSKDRPHMQEVAELLANVLVDDGKRLGVDHRDAAPVDLDAWNHLELPEEVDESTRAEPGRLQHAREQRLRAKIRALDDDIELLKEQQEQLEQHHRLIVGEARRGKQGSSHAAAIANNVAQEVEALRGELAAKMSRRHSLMAHLPSSRDSGHSNGKRHEHGHKGKHKRHHNATSSSSVMTSSSSTRPQRRTHEPGATLADTAHGAVTLIDLRPRGRHKDQCLSCKVGAMIYVTERGLSAPGSGTGGNAGGWAKGVDVHSGESGLFPLEAVRPVSSGKEVEIERLYGNLCYRKRIKADGDGAAPSPTPHHRGSKRNSTHEKTVRVVHANDTRDGSRTARDPTADSAEHTHSSNDSSSSDDDSSSSSAYSSSSASSSSPASSSSASASTSDDDNNLSEFADANGYSTPGDDEVSSSSVSEQQASTQNNTKSNNNNDDDDDNNNNNNNDDNNDNNNKNNKENNNDDDFDVDSSSSSSSSLPLIDATTKSKPSSSQDTKQTFAKKTTTKKLVPKKRKKIGKK